MRPLAVIRPEPGNAATCAAATATGLEPIALPLFEAVPLCWAPPDPAQFDALLVTSANAFHLGGSGLGVLRELPVHAVGEATARAAQGHGFGVASSGSAGIDTLLAGLEPGLRLLHLCGEHRRQPNDPQGSIAQVAVYRAAEIAADVTPCAGAVVAIHSPRAGARLAALVRQFGIDRSGIALAAISDEAALAAGPGWEQVLTAQLPTDSALLALAAQLCNCPRRQ